MSIASICGRILQGWNFLTQSIYTYVKFIWTRLKGFKIFVVFLFIRETVQLTISTFTSFCSSLREIYSGDLTTATTGIGIQGSPGDVLAIANTVLPIDELIGFIVAWLGVYAACAAIRFVRAAWAAVPFKAS